MRIWLSRLLMTVCCVCWMSAPCLAAPTAAVFVSFSIPQALLMETLKDKGCFDVVYGHLPLKEGLERIASHGECGFSMVSLLESLHG